MEINAKYFQFRDLPSTKPDYHPKRMKQFLLCLVVLTVKTPVTTK